MSYILVLLSLLAYALAAAEIKLDGVTPAELKEIEKEIAAGNVPPNYQSADKQRRGAPKLSNTDSPAFNYLSSSPTTTKSPVSPVKYVQQPYPFYQSQTPSYVPYYQPNAHHAAQIAAQYYTPQVTHFLQTPTQIQYVSNPGVGQVPSAKFQALNKATTTGAASAAPITTSASLQATPQQYYTPQYYIPQVYPTYIQPQTVGTNQGAAGQTTASTTATAARQMLQQPVVMFLINPNPYMYHQQQQLQYILGQHPLLNLYGRQLGYPGYSQPQVTYLIPMTVSQNQQSQVSSAADSTITTQESSSNSDISQATSQQPSISFGSRTKA